jgi:hypothetical protein
VSGIAAIFEELCPVHVVQMQMAPSMSMSGGMNVAYQQPAMMPQPHNSLEWYGSYITVIAIVC